MSTELVIERIPTDDDVREPEEQDRNREEQNKQPGGPLMLILQS